MNLFLAREDTFTSPGRTAATLKTKHRFTVPVEQSNVMEAAIRL
jgi:hypothetical protein